MLLDEILPKYHFHVVHSTVIQAAQDHIFRAIKETRAADIPLFNTLFWMRELPGRLAGREEATSPTMKPSLNKGSITSVLSCSRRRRTEK